MKRNFYADIWKLIFALVIASMHAGLFNLGGGYLGVEFFLFVSGFLLMQSAENSRENDAPGVQVLRKTIKKFSPVISYVFIAIVFKYIVMDSLYGLNYSSCSEKVFGFISEILLLHMYMPIENINTPLWYLSALLTVFPFAYYMVKKHGDFFINIFGTIFPIIMYGYILHTYNTLGVVFEPMGCTAVGVWRSLAGICFGIQCYRVCRWIRAKVKSYSITFTIIEWLAVGLCFALMTNLNFSHTKMDFMIMAILGIIVILIFSERTYTFKLCNRKFFEFVGKYSTAIFVSHMEWAINIGSIAPGKPVPVRILTYFVLILATAAVVLLAAEGLRWGVHRFLRAFADRPVSPKILS